MWLPAVHTWHVREEAIPNNFSTEKLDVYLCIYVCMYVRTYVCINPSIHLYIHLSIHPSIYPSIHLYEVTAVSMPVTLWHLDSQLPSWGCVDSQLGFITTTDLTYLYIAMENCTFIMVYLLIAWWFSMAKLLNNQRVYISYSIIPDLNLPSFPEKSPVMCSLKSCCWSHRFYGEKIPSQYHYPAW